MAQTDKTDGCWIWTGHMRGPNNYGAMSVGSRAQSVHRLSYEAHRGPIPPGLCVLHSCDNRKCINPDHLFLGTLGDNNRDRAQKGRTRNQHQERTECLRGHRLDGVTYSSRMGKLTRLCTTCRRIAMEAYRERRRQKRQTGAA